MSLNREKQAEWLRSRIEQLTEQLESTSSIITSYILGNQIELYSRQLESLFADDFFYASIDTGKKDNTKK